MYVSDALARTLLRRGPQRVPPCPPADALLAEIERAHTSGAASLEGGDVLFPAGYGAITDHLAKGLTIRTGRVVDRIDWTGSGVTVTQNANDVTIGAARGDAGTISLSVSDTGPGIAAKDLGRIFVPFQRLDDRTSRPGIGLGLAVARGFTEAQFIVGLDNETAETLEETFQMAWDWQPDLANWSMYTPWPFTPLFQEIRDQVEVFDYSKYNFVTPIMKPAALTRGELLDGVMKNYRRFYMRKALFHYPWRGTGFRRRYLLGCLKAFLKAGVGRTFYDLGKAGYWGPQTKGKVDFHFDQTRTIADAQMADWEASADKAAKAAERRAAVKAQMAARAEERKGFKMPEVAACGGGKEQMEEGA